MLTIPFHTIDPVILRITPEISLNWYGISYLAGVLFVMWQSERMGQKRPGDFPAGVFHNCMFWGMIAIVVGGRLGDVLFYNAHYYMQNLWEILATWKGGMSFHGGLIGALITAVIYTRYHKVRLFHFLDVLVVNIPIALMFGRFANFINGELYGRPTTAAWAIPFPKGGGVPRHPSQLYEAALEGVVLYFVLRFVYRRYSSKPGIVTAVFLMGYGWARFFVEYFRDAETLSLVQSNWLSGGQILSLPMIAAGLIVLIFVNHTPAK